LVYFLSTSHCICPKEQPLAQTPYTPPRNNGHRSHGHDVNGYVRFRRNKKYILTPYLNSMPAFSNPTRASTHTGWFGDANHVGNIRVVSTHRRLEIFSHTSIPSLPRLCHRFATNQYSRRCHLVWPSPLPGNNA
jgi:hypothetical protein